MMALCNDAVCIRVRGFVSDCTPRICARFQARVDLEVVVVVWMLTGVHFLVCVCNDASP